MKIFLFYTAEGLTYSPTNILCENYQILGFERRETQEEALNTLLHNNIWIDEYGFSIENIIVKQVVGR